jgi:hypothetical protein
LNRSIETRQRRPVVGQTGAQESSAGNPLAEKVTLARSIGPTREELERRRREQRAALVRTWPNVRPLEVGAFSAFSPYAFLHRAHVRWYPTEQQRRAALAQFRHQAESRFTHQRTDSRKPISFTFVRRPSYYAAFTAGEIVTAQQRYGLGLIWIPGVGSVLQSQTAGLATAWGTRRPDTSAVYEASSFAARTAVHDSTISLSPSNHDLPRGDVRIEYPLGEQGNKAIVFHERGVHVAVRHPGSFVEQIPLLALPSDSLTWRDGAVELRRGGGGAGFTIRWRPSSRATIERTKEESGARRVVAVAIPARDSLVYDLEIVTKIRKAAPADAGTRSPAAQDDRMKQDDKK